MVEICGQHAHYSLLKPAAHRELLDSCAANKNEVAAMSFAYEKWRRCRKNLQEAQKNADGLAAKRDTLRADCEELATLRFSADKWKDYNARLTDWQTFPIWPNLAAPLWRCWKEKAGE